MNNIQLFYNNVKYLRAKGWKYSYLGYWYHPNCTRTIQFMYHNKCIITESFFEDFTYKEALAIQMKYDDM